MTVTPRWHTVVHVTLSVWVGRVIPSRRPVNLKGDDESHTHAPPSITHPSKHNKGQNINLTLK